jgi:hypothetical protein
VYRNAVLLLLLVILLPSGAQAQTPTEEVWDDPRTVDEFLRVSNNSTLVVRGASISLRVGFLVDAGSTLILESTPERSAGIVAADDDGYQGVVLGTLEARGLPGAPVRIQGSGGTGALNANAILWKGGISVAGFMNASWVELLDHAAGLRSVNAGTIRLDHALVNSSTGIGLVSTGGLFRVVHSELRGAGATLWSGLPGVFDVEDTTLSISETPISINGGTAQLRNVSVTSNVTRCLKLTEGNLSVHGLACTGYLENGVQITAARPAFPPNAILRDLRISNTDDRSGAAVNLVGIQGIVIEDSLIGPAPRNGIRLERSSANMSGVEYRGVGEHDVIFVEPPKGASLEIERLGEPGLGGWLTAGYQFEARVLLPDLTPAPHAMIEITRERDGVSVSRQILDDKGNVEPTYLEAVSILPTGARIDHAYRIDAVDAAGTSAWQRVGYAPDGAALNILLVPVEAREVPAMGLGFLLVGTLAALLAASSYQTRAPKRLQGPFTGILQRITSFRRKK